MTLNLRELYRELDRMGLALALTDPTTNEELVLCASKGGDDEVYHPELTVTIVKLMGYLEVDQDEAIRLLRNSDVNSPVMFHDEGFWVE